jgi:anti-sigma B factor antagonist
MTMEIKSTQMKHCVLVRVIGKLDGSSAPLLSEQFKKIIDEGNYHIVLDMSKLEFISSAGLWVLVNTQKACKRFNRGEMVFSEVPARIYSALDLAGFIHYYKLFKTTTEAVGSF